VWIQNGATLNLEDGENLAGKPHDHFTCRKPNQGRFCRLTDSRGVPESRPDAKSSENAARLSRAFVALFNSFRGYKTARRGESKMMRKTYRMRERTAG